MSTSWTKPVDGVGTWRHTPKHRPLFTDTLVAFLACLIGLVLLTGLYVAGRTVMCAAYDNALRNCPGYQQPVSDGGER